MRNSLRAFTFLALFSSISTAALAARVEDAPPFSLTAKELLDEANSSGIQKTGDAILLLNEDHWTFKPDGTVHHTIHAAFQVLTQQGVSNWSALQFAWEPWREQRPVIKARTVTPDGVVHQLDPRTIADAPAGSSGPQSFSDMRVLQSPLPSVEVGAVVEQLTENDETPVLGSTAFRAFLISSVPLRIGRVIVDYPRPLPLRYKAFLAPDLKSTRTEDAAGIHLVFEAKEVEAAEEEPPLLPPDAPRYPSITFSTAPSWESIADQYTAIVDKQIAGASLETVRDALSERGGRDALIAAIVRKLHADVRYTGIEFGQAAIVPAQPDETLKRGYGDCKDKAALLVAMLRAARIPAQVALLNGGFGQDVDPDFPGMGMFNHAIVYVPGKPDIWIDATSPYSQPGMLPGPDQGRLALIAAKGTTRLTATPETPSSATLEISTHEYALPEYGPTKIVELSEGTGNIDAALRASTGPIDTDNGKKAMQAYIQKSYDTKSDIGFDHSKADDLATPFRMRLTIPDSRNLMVTESGANIPITPAALLSSLPRYFLYDDSQDPAAKKKKRERTEDFELPQAFVSETIYRIHVPPGFVLKKLPDNQDVTLGPVRLSAVYEDRKDTLVATLKLDSGKRRYSLAEAAALKKAALEYVKTPVQTVSIEPAGQADLDAGRIREAIAEFKSVSQRLPDKPLYHVQISRALLAAGCGEQARIEARRATELAPASALAWSNLGYVLQHDLVNREFKKGWDPAGAEAAYRKAIELDKDDLGARQSLAALFEYDSNGERYTSPKRLLAAIDVYHALSEEQLSQERFINPFLFVLTYAERWDELQSRLDKLPAANEYLALREIAIAAVKGVAAAISDTGKSASDQAQRTEILERSGNILSYMGRYPEAAAMLEAGATGTSDSAQVLARANYLRNVHHFDCATLKADSPENAVRRLICVSASGDADVMLGSYDAEALGKHSVGEFRDAAARSAMPGLAVQNVSRAYFIDFQLSSMKLTVDDNGSGGYRVKQTIPGSTGTQTAFVIRRGSEYKILGSNFLPQGIGREVLSELDQHRGDDARKWLNWLREDMKAAGGDDPLTGPMFPHLWVKGVPGTDQQVRLAAASIIAPTGDGEEVLPVLKAAAEQGRADPKRDYIEFAYILSANSARTWSDALPVAKELAKRHPESAIANSWVSILLCSLKRGGEAEQFAQDWLKRDPDSLEAQRAYDQVLQSESKFRDAEEHIRKVAESANAGPQDWNDYGWTALFAGDLTPEKLEAVRHGIGSDADPAILHTLASMYAELGNGSEAREELLGAMNSWGLGAPNPDCWYVFGRIAEGYGVKDAAANYYNKLQPPANAREQNTSTYALAQKRLASLR